MEKENIFPIVLAGGFGVRTEGILDGIPKTLIIAPDGKTLFEHLLRDLENNSFGSVPVVTNSRFSEAISAHLKGLVAGGLKINVEIFDNGAKMPEERLGALGDLIFGIEKSDPKDSSILVLSSDYAYWKSFSIGEFVNFSQEEKSRGCFLVIVRDMGNKSLIKKRFGCPVLGKDGFISSFEEKPQEPQSSFAVVAFYLYRPDQIKFLKEYKDGGGNLDSPSNIIPPFLGKGVKIRAFVVEKDVVDAGTPEDIKRAQNY